tara:strand:+ start:183 stop:656 length:474 start_codon:yes stop_codon:yes gene_type:complete
MSVYLNKDGIYNTQGRIVEYAYGSHAGARINLGFFGAVGGHPYIHIKTSAGGSADRMHKFEYDGYTYSSVNAHNSVTFYTYGGTSTPYEPSLVNWGETVGGIVNYYYSSSDDKIVIVLQTSGSYTGGFLYHQTGKSHTDFDIEVLAHTSSSSTSGAY